jgi:hypothetical protein
MRANISEIGSVTGIYYLLPARLGDTGNKTFMNHFSQAATTKAEVSIKAPWPAANSATVVETDSRIFALHGKHPPFMFLVNN